ncbi:cupin domain-containing protein [Pelagimonas sp. KU-00592-HH]|uniref:cupin domain-containing protein n=1 Tax=Pelagimonas sp. KU-00592-HH TaxID=3127651 RepID=UPI0031020E08
MTRLLHAVTLVLALGAATTPLAAQEVTRTEIRRVDAPGSTTHEVIVSRLEVAPGATIPRHTHPGDEHMVVLEGGEMKAPNGKIIPFALGDTALFPAGQVHGGLTNAGTTPLVALTTHIVEKGQPFMTLAE